MKSNLDSLYKTKKELEVDGVWMPLSKETSFKVKRFGGKNSSAVKRAISKHHAPKAALIQKGLIDEDEERALLTRAYVEATLIDWKGVKVDENGEQVELPFSVDNAVELLCDLPDLMDEVVRFASDMSNFKEDLGNS